MGGVTLGQVRSAGALVGIDDVSTHWQHLDAMQKGTTAQPSYASYMNDAYLRWRHATISWRRTSVRMTFAVNNNLGTAFMKLCFTQNKKNNYSFIIENFQLTRNIYKENVNYKISGWVFIQEW